MTRLTSATITICLGIIFCFEVASAQTKPGEAETNAELRTRAFAVLESVADEIGTLQSAENRARLGSNIAASLWSHDERRARSLLVAVQNDINAGLQNQDDGDNWANAETRMIFFHLRADTIERISPYDADFALEFFKATEPPPSDKELPYQFVAMERQLELQLANQIAAHSPEVALKIARQMLNRGFSYELQSMLRQLNRKHKEQAADLYKEIVAKLRDTDFTKTQGGFDFAMQLAHSFKPPSVDASAYRELINVLIDYALAHGCGNKKTTEDEKAWFCYQFGSLLPAMQSVDPSRAARLKQWGSEEDSEFQWSRETYAEFQDDLNDLPQDATVDQVLALIPKYPQMAEQIYLKAMGQAVQQGDIERARKITTDYITQPEERQYILSQIDRAEKRSKLNESNLAEIQQRLAEMPNGPQRMMMLMNFASQIGATDRKSALKLLDQAREIVETMKPGREQTEAQVRLAMRYCLEKTDRGLDIMESIMPRVNDLVAAAAKLDGYENHYLRDGEWNMGNEGTLGQLLTSLSQNAAYFSWCDLDRALSVAAQFERPELRLMARMKLAQSILAGPPKRTTILDGPVRY
jgi:hypothetical protein